MSGSWDVIILGCGHLGGNLKRRLEAENLTVLGVRRTVVADDPSYVSLDLDAPDAIDRLAEGSAHAGTVWVGIVTPDERTAAAYQTRYVGLADRLAHRFVVHPNHQAVVWVSSTAVFGSSQTGVLDEIVDPTPDAWRGELVRAAEQRIETIANSVVLRLTGLYSRDSLARLAQPAVRSGLQESRVSNRIHREDAVRWLADLVLALVEHRVVPALIHGVDECPATYAAVFARLDGRSERLVAATTGRIIHTRYRDRLPPLVYPTLDAVLAPS